jgi:endoglucanase
MLAPMPMSRRLLLSAALAPSVAGRAQGRAILPAAPPTPELTAAWAGFRQAFLRPEGRVVDTGNGGISHSEGQGWAMFCAERCANRADFDLIWNWTRQALGRRRDRLLVWRFVPGPLRGAPDGNNAADGDLFAAAALLLAARRWDDAGYAEAGTAMARDVLRLLVRQVAGLTVLLPGLDGFEDATSVTLNPSYYAFPLFGVLARAVPDPVWLRLAADGLELLRRARFGRWGLPPDWLVLRRSDGALSLPEGWPKRFSFDAIRVPFYLSWADLREEPAVQAALSFWNDSAHPVPPAWADLVSDSVAPYAASAGLREVVRFIADRPLYQNQPKVDSREDYYSAILRILAIATLK